MVALDKIKGLVLDSLFATDSPNSSVIGLRVSSGFRVYVYIHCTLPLRALPGVPHWRQQPDPHHSRSPRSRRHSPQTYLISFFGQASLWLLRSSTRTRSHYRQASTVNCPRSLGSTTRSSLSTWSSSPSLDTTSHTTSESVRLYDTGYGLRGYNSTPFRNHSTLHTRNQGSNLSLS